MSDGPPPGAETKSQAPGVLTFLAGNIASLSAIGVVATVVCSTLFLYGYLSVFDWRLIWIIDYSDIFKIGLVTLAALAGAIVILLFGLQMFLRALRVEGSRRRGQIAFLATLTGLAWGIFALLLLSRQPGPYSHAIFALLLVLALGFYVVAGGLLTGFVALTTERALGLSALLFMAVGAAGWTFGILTKFSEGSRYDVFLKDREMADVRLVLFTSHHTASTAATK
jgi:hypothetical protein